MRTRRIRVVGAGAMDARDGVVEVGERVDSADDDLIQIDATAKELDKTGYSREIAWADRPEAARLIAAITDPAVGSIDQQ